jgi:hypothetical protein
VLVHAHVPQLPEGGVKVGKLVLGAGERGRPVLRSLLEQGELFRVLPGDDGVLDSWPLNELSMCPFLRSFS